MVAAYEPWRDRYDPPAAEPTESEAAEPADLGGLRVGARLLVVDVFQPVGDLQGTRVLERRINSRTDSAGA